MKIANSSLGRKKAFGQKNNNEEGPQDIRERTFEFAVRIVRMVEFLESQGLLNRNIRNQVLRSGTSIGANLEEGVASESRRDFIHKNAIGSKEARETNYWLRIIIRVVECDEKTLKGLSAITIEAEEIMKILGKIISRSKHSG